MKVRALGATTYVWPRFSASLLLVTAAYLAVGLVAGAVWRFTGDNSWIEGYFRVPAALLSAFLAVVQFWFGLQVRRRFEPGEAMHPAWLCISGSAAFNVAGVLLSQILSVESALNPLVGASWWSTAAADSIRRCGQLLGGTGRFLLLSIGLWMVLKIYRQHGLLTKPKPLDWAAFALLAAYVVREVLDMAEAGKHRSFSGTELASWPTDPLLLILLIGCTLLYRSNQRMGPGAIGRCWNAFAVGVALVCIGLVALWAGRWGYLPWPYSSLFWYVWLPADAAFALAPIYHLEAIEQAGLPSQGGR